MKKNRITFCNLSASPMFLLLFIAVQFPVTLGANPFEDYLAGVFSESDYAAIICPYFVERKNTSKYKDLVTCKFTVVGVIKGDIGFGDRLEFKRSVEAEDGAEGKNTIELGRLRFLFFDREEDGSILIGNGQVALYTKERMERFTALLKPWKPKESKGGK